jgi:glutamyl-tRNA reductase
LRNIHILAFTHRQLEVSQIGLLHISTDNQRERLHNLKVNSKLDELLFLSTCNRVEYIFKTNQEVDEQFIQTFIINLYPDFSDDLVDLFCQNYEYYQEINAVKHLLKVASSVDSMVVGEREIITQVRKSFDMCKEFGLTGDNIRLLIRFTIESAKRIYTETNISQRAVSVVSLAYQTLQNKNIPLDARFLVVGAGVTNTNMLRFLKEHGFSNFVVFNRTLAKADKLAADVGGIAYPLTDLVNYKKGFDVIITCTGSEEAVITTEIYERLLQGDTSEKTVIDLAIPHDLDPAIPRRFVVEHISIDYLQSLSRKNIKERTKEIIYVEHIIAEAVLEFKKMAKQREVELAMRQVPEKVKEIKTAALEQVFAKELAQLDGESKETVEKIIDYLEKKYISLPMKMAKDILLNAQ